MNIGVTVDDNNLNSIVSEKFSGCKYLIIVNIDDQSVGKDLRIKNIMAVKNQDNDSRMKLAQELIDFDCEAVITGELEPAEFDLIADACITRYYGAGCQASDALERMEKRELSLIRNLQGTDGCDGSHHKHE